MNWTYIIIAIISSGVLSTIINIVANKRKARIESDSKSLQNMKEVYFILREEYERYRTKADSEYKRYDAKIEGFENKIHEMEAIIEEFRRCSFYIEKGKCPVKKRKFITYNSEKNA
jgi:hypothetical protein